MPQAPFCPWEPQPAPSPQYREQPSGYASPQYQPSYQQFPGPPPIEEIIRRECDLCKSYIKPGEAVVESFYGIEGRSEQTGMALAVDPPGERMLVTVVHRECQIDHAIEQNPEVADECLNDTIEERALEMFNEMMQDQDGDLNRRLADESA